MPTIVPSTRPGLTLSTAKRLLAQHGVTDKVALIGVRGYYLRSMGDKDRNDRGIYDDAIAIVSPAGIWTFNANADPSIFRKGIATLKPGVHRYRKGRHGISRGPGYDALRPATEGERLPVVRDPGVSDWGIAINIHKGSRNSTSSEGCQTIHPEQWSAFIAMVYGEVDRHGQRTVPYLLVVNDGSIA
ncbi:MAG: hypothetical protein ACO1SV_27575 [Fimbriimonas sp.]